MSYQFVRDETPLKGKRATCVAQMIQQLIDAGGEPIPWATMCEDAGMDHHGQLMPAMHALELAGVIERYQYVEPGARRAQAAFALSSNVEVDTDA